VITPDGCAVDLYAMMPAFGEPAIMHAAALERPFSSSAAGLRLDRYLTEDHSWFRAVPLARR
jgi:hypothetical protein